MKPTDEANFLEHNLMEWIELMGKQDIRSRGGGKGIVGGLLYMGGEIQSRHSHRKTFSKIESLNLEGGHIRHVGRSTNLSTDLLCDRHNTFSIQFPFLCYSGAESKLVGSRPSVIHIVPRRHIDKAIPARPTRNDQLFTIFRVPCRNITRSERHQTFELTDAYS